MKVSFSIAFIVYAFACVLHLAVIIPILPELPTCCVKGDSFSYINYWDSDTFNFQRTPGYPLFIKIVSLISENPFSTILVAQAFIISLAPALVTLFILTAFPSWTTQALIGGMTCALSFQSKEFVYRVLTEAIFSPLIVLAFLLFFVGFRKDKTTVIMFAAITAGIATLVRPNFMIFTLLIPILAYCFSEDGFPPKRKKIIQACLVTLIFPLSLATTNYFKFGVFSPSSIAVETAVYYWGARTLNIVKHPTDTYGVLAFGFRNKLQEEANKQKTLKEKYIYNLGKIKSIVSKYPAESALAFYRSLVSNIPKPFSLSNLDRTVFAGLVAWWLPLDEIFYILVIVGAYRLFREYDKRLAISLVLFSLFYWLPTGISYWQGTRLSFPMEPFLVLLYVFSFAPQPKGSKFTWKKINIQ